MIAATVNTNIKAAQAMQQQLSLAGIKTKVLELDTAGLNALISQENNTSQMVVFAVKGSLSASFARAAFYVITSHYCHLYYITNQRQFMQKRPKW